MDGLDCDCGGCDGCGDCGDCGDCCGPSDCDCCGGFLAGCCLGSLCCSTDERNKPTALTLISTALIAIFVFSIVGYFIFHNKEEPSKPKVEEVKKSGWQKTKSIIHELTK